MIIVAWHWSRVLAVITRCINNEHILILLLSLLLIKWQILALYSDTGRLCFWWPLSPHMPRQRGTANGQRDLGYRGTRRWRPDTHHETHRAPLLSFRIVRILSVILHIMYVIAKCYCFFTCLLFWVSYSTFRFNIWENYSDFDSCSTISRGSLKRLLRAVELWRGACRPHLRYDNTYQLYARLSTLDLSASVIDGKCWDVAEGFIISRPCPRCSVDCFCLLVCILSAYSSSFYPSWQSNWMWYKSSLLILTVLNEETYCSSSHQIHQDNRLPRHNAMQDRYTGRCYTRTGREDMLGIVTTNYREINKNSKVNLLFLSLSLLFYPNYEKMNFLLGVYTG